MSACALPLIALLLAGDPIAPGSARIELDLEGLSLEVFTHKPATYTGERMVVVLHGVNRNADEYRDHAVSLSERAGALIVAPRFDAERFPSRAYQRGGILRADGTAAAPKEWTYARIPEIARRVRELEERPELPFWILGHSAGGQFAMRMSAFQETGAERIVAANPGSSLFPTRAMDFGYGFGGLPEELCGDAALERYLAAPLTLYLGTADDGEDRWLDTSPPAMEQGPGRLQRNRAAFAMAEALAREKGWEFTWRIVEAEGVGHDHQAMFDHERCADALFGAAREGAEPEERSKGR